MYYNSSKEFKNINGYEVDGIWYPRVTKILEIKSKPALENFFKEVGHYDSAEQIKNKSAQEGTRVHEAVQKFFTGDTSAPPPEIIPALSALQTFHETRNIFFHPEFVERRIWSRRYRYAGTVDALATIDGKFGVLDIKTSTGFYPEYNLQTAAYLSALQEFEIKRILLLPKEIETRWILRIDQHRRCGRCCATLREKGGRMKVRPAKKTEEGREKAAFCPEDSHEWGETEGDVALKEFPYAFQDMKAFVAAKILWEWENSYWLRQIQYR